MFQNVPLASFREFRGVRPARDHGSNLRIKVNRFSAEHEPSTSTLRAALFCAEFFRKPIWRIRIEEKEFSFRLNRAAHYCAKTTSARLIAICSQSSQFWTGEGQSDRCVGV